MYKSKKFHFLIAILLLLLASNLATYLITANKRPAERAGEMITSDNAHIESDYNLLFNIVDILSRDYLEEFNREELIEGAIDGLLKTLNDPQTTFLDAAAMGNLLVSLKGSFGGIGVKITDSIEGITIIEVIPDTPADEAGLQPGDRIFFVDEVDVGDYDVEKAVMIIRGEKGSEVIIRIKRPGVADLMDFTLVREDIITRTVNGEWIEPKIAYISISQFDGTTGNDFLELIDEMEKEGLKGLVLDLRDNPGGVLHEVLKVAREIVPEGEIVRIVDRNGQAKEIYHSFAKAKDYPIVVLINNGSASGSEIIAGALQDVGAALLVGEDTYGKATVQHFETFKEGSGLRYTVAKYVTPAGKDIHGDGIKPDYAVEVPLYHRYFYYLAPGKVEEKSYGDAVLILQEMLAALEYDIEPTGYFDDVTVKSLRQFQEEFGLEAHGKFDGVTWIYLRRELEKVIREEDYQLLKAIQLIKER